LNLQKSATLKAIGVNIYRAAAVRKADNHGTHPFGNALAMRKEQFRKIVSPLQYFYDNQALCRYREPEWHR
jgi:hypothetical protein